MTRISLLATAMSLPASIAARAGRKPATPTIAMRTRSASGRVASSTSPSSPVCSVTSDPTLFDRSSNPVGSKRQACLMSNSSIWLASDSTLRLAASPITFISSGMSRATLRLLSPIEPVEPSTTTFFLCGESDMTDHLKMRR